MLLAGTPKNIPTLLDETNMRDISAAIKTPNLVRTPRAVDIRVQASHLGGEGNQGT